MTNQPESTDTGSLDRSRLCPGCRGKGSRVGRVTLESLLEPGALERLTDEQFRFCDSADCDVVYFGDRGTVFSKDDLVVRVGVKERSAPRPVCYCFDHTVEEIDAEVERTGRCTVFDDIRTRMKDGCWCETKNPKGSCCLGTVGRYVRLALAEHGGDGGSGHAEETPEDNRSGGCCATNEAEPHGTDTVRRPSGSIGSG